MKRIYCSVPALFALLTISFSTAQEDSRLRVIEDSWQRARERALTPIDRKYQTELKKLINNYTKAGKLDSALAAKLELARVQKMIETARADQLAKKQADKKDTAINIKKDIPGDWTWFGKNAGSTFLENGTFKHFYDLSKPPAPGSWKKHSDTSVMVTLLDSGNQFEVELSRTKTKADVTRINSGSKFQITKK